MPVQQVEIWRRLRNVAAGAGLVLAVVLYAAAGPGETSGVRGRSFVGERTSDEGSPEGRFDVHWESADGRTWQRGPEDVSIAVGLSWARSRSEVVIVRSGEGDAYSAGSVAAGEFPEFTDGLANSFRPRPLASRWKVRVPVPDRAERAREVLGALKSSPLVDAVELVDSGAHRDALFVVQADTARGATEVVDGLLADDVYDGDARTYNGGEWSLSPGFHIGPVIEVIGPA